MKKQIATFGIPIYEFTDLDRECLITAKKFSKWVAEGYVMDYDGSAKLALEYGVSMISTTPSSWLMDKRLGFSHVCWYNR